MNLTAIQSMVRSLECDRRQIPACYLKLEEAIAWPMDRTFESKDGNEQDQLTLTELRARGVLKRYHKADVN